MKSFLCVHDEGGLVVVKVRGIPAGETTGRSRARERTRRVCARALTVTRVRARSWGRTASHLDARADPDPRADLIASPGRGP